MYSSTLSPLRVSLLPCRRLFTTQGGQVYSYIGQKPLVFSTDVQVTHESQPFRKDDPRFTNTTRVRITGPLGEMVSPLEPFVKLEPCDVTEDDTNLNRRRMLVKVEDPAIKHQRSMWGTTRTVLQNSIIGVSEGYTVPLRLVGVGFRATLEKAPVTESGIEGNSSGQMLSLKIGYSHPVTMVVPPGITASTPNPTRILLKGCNWQQLKLFAATIRSKRKPEPYNQKGIFVGDETIKKKEGKKK
ncbi:54S ribosomal protein L6 mitochondrial [Dispira simplex]|nr:54S ribosomal protein L6 mitochondrial [Dispira simplex]